MELVKPKKSFDLEVLITSVKYIKVEADSIEEVALPRPDYADQMSIHMEAPA